MAHRRLRHTSKKPVASQAIAGKPRGILHKAAHFGLALAILLSVCFMGAFPLTAKAADEEYTYTVRFFAGTKGEHKNGQEIVIRKDLQYGDRVTFDPKREITLLNNKYYVRGIRESGKDNNTTVTDASPSFTVTGDQDYVVTYGILGNAVEYRVRFVDEDGRELAEEEVYYGNVGDTPAVAYLYIENYLPQAYAITGELSADASKNIFTFVYKKMTEEAAAAAQQAVSQLTPAPAATTTTTTPATTPTAPTTPEETETPETPGIDVPDPEVPTGAVGDTATSAAGEIDNPPEELVTIGDEETPLANQKLNNEEFAKVLLNIPLAGKVGICSIVFLLGAAGGIVLTYRKRKVKDAK